jgi:hypothetical protein
MVAYSQQTPFPSLFQGSTQRFSDSRDTMLISSDNHVWPIWAPDWLRAQVTEPNCSNGTHPRLLELAKWLTIYFREHEDEAARWLYHAAQRCARDVDDGEVRRLLIWAEGLFGDEATYTANTANTANPLYNYVRGKGDRGAVEPQKPRVNLDEIYAIAVVGPRLAEYRESSPEQLSGPPIEKNQRVLKDWAKYAHTTDPLVCFGSKDHFWTRPLSTVYHLLHIHEQIVPSPMRALQGLTQSGHLSAHSKDGTGPRLFLVTEFDFSRLTPKGKPTIWEPLLERCEAKGLTVLDINAALLAHLAKERPLWLTVFSGSKSLQGWFPVRNEDEQSLHRWFNDARRLGADPMTWCKSQFVRMPCGYRAPNREGKCAQQTIEYYNPSALTPPGL